MNEIKWIAKQMDVTPSGLTIGSCAWGMVNGDIKFALHPVDTYRRMIHVCMFPNPEDKLQVASFYMSPGLIMDNLDKLAQVFPPF